MPFSMYSLYFVGGDEGTRTLDPYTASVMLSQLSYTPVGPFLKLLISIASPYHRN